MKFGHKTDNVITRDTKEEYWLDRIKDTYGSPERLAQHLDLGIEMLFYLEEDTFEKREVQQVVSALRGIAHILRQ